MSVENDRRQLLNSLSDAIKECQLRFGGKRELATETDGRVCYLCSKLEQIFLHGLRRNVKAVANLTSTANTVLANTKNTLINLKNNGINNLFNQFFEDPSRSDAVVLNYNEAQFWAFIKNFLNKFDIERFEQLASVKTDVARQRSWIRNCLNEHSLERYTMAILSNETLIHEFYEDWCLLLDKEFNTTLPMLVSGLQSVLFAINIDNPNFNLSPKIVDTTTTEAINIKSKNRSNTTTVASLGAVGGFGGGGGNSLEQVEQISTRLNKKTNKIRKNNVVVFDIEEDPPSQVVSQEVIQSPSVLTNPIRFNKSSPQISNESLREAADPKLAVSDTSGDSLSEKLSDKYKYSANYSQVNLIPLNPTSYTAQNGVHNTDTLSINSYQSGDGLSPNDTIFINSAYSNFNRLNDKIKNSNLLNPKASTSLSQSTENLSLVELREVVLAMIHRKEEIEQKMKTLLENYNEEKLKNKGLAEKTQMLESEAKMLKDNYQGKLHNLEYENILLKEQLKKYVSAMQLIRSNDSELVSVSKLGPKVSTPILSDNLPRDYSFEAEQYEKKLIQVAEMHGELMEFNSKLHHMLNFRTSQVEKLKLELIELRGPLSADQMNEMDQENGLDQSYDAPSLSTSLTIPSTFINIWIPSVFLRSENKASHHVYQVYIQIKDEEWNIYRRFSHFYNLNQSLTTKYPIISTVPFPKKKAIGNKDEIFVEKRRKQLQGYLRLVLNKLLTLDKDLNAKPCRESLTKAVSFLSDQQHFSSDLLTMDPILSPEAAASLNPALRSFSIIPSTSGLNGLIQGNKHIRAQSTVLLNGSNSLAGSPSGNQQPRNELFYNGL